ncbi:PREDICTED: lissencephaly-1 homolog isoform X1 [Amphimedon queenslandica]|uniref:Anaphase-promoting complex subunit 4 WD40 domain-containing protein n=2 Tax=Amphimedon queenslandica TaxID=400682 RepID=A0AAN0IP70_AMPQE|nr:PREDICTED: lissencephaly-1 homolog isoform X1 [Amphimedon queenslandica]|eukprot:XP_011406116.1 PREDICTED: lissencephaly-1 homolog isoform X1 [Amphimedon queenslandica]
MEDLKFRRIVSSRHRVEFLAFSSSKRWGTLLGACFGDYSVRLYDCSGNEEAVLLACFTEHASNVWGLCFSSDGSLLASCSSDKQLIVYSVDQVSVLKVLTLHSGTVWSCKFTSQKLLASASEDCTVKITSVNTGDVSSTVSFNLPLESLDISKEKELMCVSASRYGKVWILASQESKPIEVYSSEVGVHAVQFIRDNKDTEYLVVSTQSHAILVYLMTDVLVNASCNSPPAFVLEGHCNIIWRFCSISNECSTTLISASGDKTVRFWDLITRKCVHVLRYFQGSLDPNSQILACDFIQGKEDYSKLSIGTYDGCIYIGNLVE